MSKTKYIFILAVIIWIAAPASLPAQQKKLIRCKISYVAASVVYVDAGRDSSLAVGDTLHIYKGLKEIGQVEVTAVSSKSSAAKIISQSEMITSGNEARIAKIIFDSKSADVPSLNGKNESTQSKTTVINGRKTVSDSDENIVTGRIGIQYSGVFAENSRLNVSQPASLLRLSVQNLFGSGLVFSMYGRSYYDMTDIYSRYSPDSRFKNRMYEFSLQTNDPNAQFGYGVGRMTSWYVGGMGTFDGGHFYYRNGNITAGALLGSQIMDRTYGFDGSNKKGAVFVNARIGSDFMHEYNGTIAYGKQFAKDRLDREFLYIQNSWMASSEFSLYETTELELNDINNGVRTRALKLSNTYLSLNYYPTQWLSTNLGYDGSRPVYLFYSMRSFSDTLFDKNLLQGYRGGATVRLPYFITVSGNLMYRTRSGDARDARNLSGSIRMSDVLGSEVGAGIRYADIVGVYSNGSNFTVDLDRTFFYALSLSLRYDYYKYTVLTQKQTYITQTGTLSSSYRISRMLYTSLSVDGVLDATMNSMRVYADIGIRF
jgi:hypothetical protein